LTSKKENTKEQQKHVETSRHYKSSERSAFVWEKLSDPLFFYPTLSLGLTNSLFILLPSWHFVPTWQAGSKVLLRRMRWKKKPCYRQVQTHPQGMGGDCQHHQIQQRNSKVARSRSCGSFMVSHLQPDHSPSQLSNAQHDRPAFQNVQAPAAFSSWIPAQHSLKVNPDFQDRIT